MNKPLSFFLPMIPPTVTVDWAVVSGFGDKYLIRRDGTVMNRKTGKILKHILKSDGYLAVHLSYENKAKMVMVHRLVAEAFLPNPKNLPVVNHIDGNKTNPNVENLEWVTFS
ncbi:MAG: HNH endonuclease, partial [Oscillospiraceae bacterium]|nr:HNH endonuclease [Oscillospiraceae bacterium]